MVRINYFGVLNCTRTVLDVMIGQERGAIVSISSDASRQGEPREAVYGGIKAAINSFMKTIAKENGRYGIRCNVVLPRRHDPRIGRGNRRAQHVGEQGHHVHRGAVREDPPRRFP